jgi:hypothetical protein
MVFQNDLLLSGISTKILYAFLASPLRASCQYALFREAPPHAVFSSFLRPNIFLATSFEIINSFNVTDQFSLLKKLPVLLHKQ